MQASFFDFAQVSNEQRRELASLRKRIADTLEQLCIVEMAEALEVLSHSRMLTR